MDKNEYRAKLDEINDLVDRQDYRGALKIVDTIDWRRVRSARTLCMVGEIYEANKRYEDSRKLLLMAHHRAPIGRTVLYRLVELCVPILSENPLFFLLNSYTTGLSPAVMEYLLGVLLQKRFGGQVSSGEIGLPVTSTGLTLPCGSTAIWQR